MILLHDVSILFNSIFMGLSLVLSLILWNQKTSYRLSNRLLSLLLVAMAITTFNTIVRLSYYMESMDFFQNISNSTLLLMGPAIYLFVKSRLAEFKNYRWVIHFIPFSLYMILSLIFSAFSLSEEIDSLNNIAFLLFVSQWLIYITAAFSLINTYHQQIRQNFSNLSKHDLSWFKVVLTLFLAVLILRLALLLYSTLVEKVPDVLGLNLTLGFAVITCYLGYKTFKNPELFTKINSYAQSSLSLSDLNDYKEKIDTVMKDLLLHTNPKLTISDLSEQTKLHSRVISQTLNQGMNQNFFDFVNTYRVNELIEKLKDSRSSNYTLQALMEESGFQSPSVAYAAFKKVTGMTPAKYRKIYSS